jgi:hypothetical protein
MNAAEVESIPERIHHEAITHLLQRIPAICRGARHSTIAGHVQTAGIGCARARWHVAGQSL